MTTGTFNDLGGRCGLQCALIEYPRAIGQGVYRLNFTAFHSEP